MVKSTRMCLAIAMVIVFLVTLSWSTPNPSIPVSQFRMDVADFPPDVRLSLVHAYDRMPVFPNVTAAPKAKGMRVPNIVHYTYLTPKDDVPHAKPLEYLYYLGMRSTIEVLRPDVIMLHYNALPHGPWWDEIAPFFTLNKVHLPDSIFGKPVEHLAHKSDIIRLLAIRHYGGIYMDLDQFAVRPFDELMYAPATMAFQLRPENQFANGCFLAEPHSRFMDLWWQSYEHFDVSAWDYNSGGRPMELARAYPDDIQALNGLAFFWPPWGEAENLLAKDEYDFRATGQYAYHAWNRQAGASETYARLNPSEILTINTSFNRLVRPFVGPRDVEIYQRLHQ